MTKIAIVTDTHFGIRSDSPQFLKHQVQFFEQTFFPEIDSRGISTIIHLGDLVDRRKFINFNTLSVLKHNFIDKLNRYDFHIIAGNHDVFYKSTNELNALDLLIDSNNHNIKIYIDPAEVNIDGIPIVFVPWINQQNSEQTFQLIANTNSQLCFGHLEIAGFEMFKGSVCDHGLQHSIFNKFDCVLTGHFHHKSSKANIHYLGAPYQMTWSDYGYQRGFHIFDLETRQLEFIVNPQTMFVRLVYDDAEFTIEQMLEQVSKSNLVDKFCKVDIINKSNPYGFDLIFDAIEQQKPYDIKINDLPSIVDDQQIDYHTQVQDTQTLIFSAVDRLEINCNKTELKQLMGELYIQALEVDINS